MTTTNITVLIGLLAGLAYTAVGGVDTLSSLVVLGGIVLTTVGTLIAIDPLRRD